MGSWVPHSYICWYCIRITFRCYYLNVVDQIEEGFQWYPQRKGLLVLMVCSISSLMILLRSYKELLCHQNLRWIDLICLHRLNCRSWWLLCSCLHFVSITMQASIPTYGVGDMNQNKSMLTKDILLVLSITNLLLRISISIIIDVLSSIFMT